MKHCGKKNLIVHLCVVVGVLNAAPVFGQWVEQSFPLDAGWNSIHLEVDPTPRETDQLFAGLPVESVWTASDDPVTELLPEGETEPQLESEWWVWFPPSDPASIANSLRVIRGGRVYLIKATAPTTLTVTGTPSSAKTQWRKGFTLNGFHVDPAGPPTFVDYLGASTAHGDSDIYQVQPDGSLAAVADTQGTCSGGDDDGGMLSDGECGGGGTCTGAVTNTIAGGTGYWVSADAAIEYDGPLSIDKGSLRGIQYGTAIAEHDLTVENVGSSSRDVHIALAPSAMVPATPGLPASAGGVPMRWLDYGGGSLVDDVYQRMDVPAAGGGSASWTLDQAGTATARQTVHLDVNRGGLAGSMVESVCVGGPKDGEPCGISGDCGEGGTCGESGSQYESVLVVTDGAGYRRFLPVTAEVLTGGGLRGSGSPLDGLWVGQVTVDKVSWVTAPLSGEGDPAMPRPTPASFSFRVMIHLSDSGEYKLLTEVTQIFEPGDEATETPGRFVLATPDCPPAFCDGLQAGDIVDGEPFALRLSTPAFRFDGDQVLTGDFGSTLTAGINIAPDHRLNPFRHRQHPDHSDGFDIDRTITLTFSADPPPGVVAAGWGYSVLGGTYDEIVDGLHRDPIYVSGNFELRRVSQIATLNGQ